MESFGVDVSFFGAEFQRGRDHFQQGPFQITFNNKWDFSNLVVGQSTGEVACSTRKRMREIGLVVPEPRSFRRFVSNQAFLDRIVSRICNGLVPLHLVVITSGESINPFNSYMIYHSSLSGFLHDIRKVLQLHELGGGYFYEGIRRFSSGPSRSSLRDGFSDYASAPFDSARSPSEAEELIQRLDDYVDLIGTPGKGELQLSDEQIYEALLLSSEVEVREIGGGVMLVQPEMPFRCLDSPFFGLLHAVCKSKRFLN